MQPWLWVWLLAFPLLLAFLSLFRVSARRTAAVSLAFHGVHTREVSSG
jgi:hypothetical protein